MKRTKLVYVEKSPWFMKSEEMSGLNMTWFSIIRRKVK